ncbi:hypothetical protein AVEN_95298-1 [Araneus ventricosus]|uniref:Uncharacterized protein n=1 Tax=Araneus ventricosus TaxID=182803 RepID=A0A4Y2KLD3_ARAVE|nr:hypothetical protein AVEN_95298-1 [Araneus ventricosus]
MILIRRLSIPSIPGDLPDGRCSITAEISWGRMEDHVAVLRWLDCNLLEWQGKGKSGPGCFVLPLADFPLGSQLHRRTLYKTVLRQCCTTDLELGVSIQHTK